MTGGCGVCCGGCAGGGCVGGGCGDAGCGAPVAGVCRGLDGGRAGGGACCTAAAGGAISAAIGSAGGVIASAFLMACAIEMTSPSSLSAGEPEVPAVGGATRRAPPGVRPSQTTAGTRPSAPVRPPV